MDFDGKRMEELAAALIAAFPDRFALDRMLLFKMEADLDRITEAASLDERIFYVVKWAWSKHRLDDLLAAALSSAPGSAGLAALASASVMGRNDGSPTASGEPADNGDPTVGTGTTRSSVLDQLGRHLWKNGRTLRVRFLDGDPVLQQKVMKVAEEWTQHANLRFHVIDSEEEDLRVSFKQAGSWSLTGTQALVAPRAEPTINFGWLDASTPDEEIHRTVLHEFGHVLGMIHEFQNPGANIDWNWNAVYELFSGPPNNWTKDAIDATFKPYDVKDLPHYRDFDPDSIMMFSFPAELTHNNVAFKQGSTLSESDKLFAAALYPRDGAARDRAAPREAPPKQKPTTPRISPSQPSPPRSATPAAPANGGKMLFLAAQPLDEPPLALNQEYAEILAELQGTDAGRRIFPLFLPRVQFSDLNRQLLDHEPLIVHYSGHGDREGRLMFTDTTNNAEPAPPRQLARLFKLLQGRIRCVFLNACYSKMQAEAIRQHIDFVIGMSRAVKDRDAIIFAKTFYMALARGQSVPMAFDLGCVQIGMTGVVDRGAGRDITSIAEAPVASDEQVPVLLMRDGVDDASPVLARP